MDPTYHPSANDGDLLPVVDEHDRVVGRAPRREVHLKRLLHRAVHIVITRRNGTEVLLQHRSAHKDSHPAWWDISVGGHVDPDEDYESAAVRELREEMGVVGTLVERARRPAAADSGWEFVRIYECAHEGPFAPAPSEVDEIRWASVEELLQRATSDGPPGPWRITGSGLASIRLWAAARPANG
jgi:isopentenyldiphosphate isomerase